jgi:hypothetical protein
VLAGPHYGSEAILTADINLDEIVEGKSTLANRSEPARWHSRLFAGEGGGGID